MFYYSFLQYKKTISVITVLFHISMAAREPQAAMKKTVKPYVSSAKITGKTQILAIEGWISQKLLFWLKDEEARVVLWGT